MTAAIAASIFAVLPAGSTAGVWGGTDVQANMLDITTAHISRIVTIINRFTSTPRSPPFVNSLTSQRPHRIYRGNSARGYKTGRRSYYHQHHRYGNECDRI